MPVANTSFKPPKLMSGLSKLSNKMAVNNMQSSKVTFCKIKGNG